eukprot:7490275-Pyramimonas_sp.AAC.1
MTTMISRERSTSPAHRPSAQPARSQLLVRREGFTTGQPQLHRPPPLLLIAALMGPTGHSGEIREGSFREKDL